MRRICAAGEPCRRDVSAGSSSSAVGTAGREARGDDGFRGRKSQGGHRVGARRGKRTTKLQYSGARSDDERTVRAQALSLCSVQLAYVTVYLNIQPS